MKVFSFFCHFAVRVVIVEMVEINTRHIGKRNLFFFICHLAVRVVIVENGKINKRHSGKISLFLFAILQCASS